MTISRERPTARIDRRRAAVLGCLRFERWSSVLVAFALYLFVAGGAPRASSKEEVVPADVQAALTLRILEYDRALKSWAGPNLVVGIVVRGAGSAEGAFREGLVGHSAQGVQLHAAGHVFHDAERLKGWIDRDRVRFLYVSSDLGSDAGAVMSVAAVRRLPALASDQGQFENGGALGIVVRDGKPRILVNLRVARAAGMDLDPKLLELSDVVR